MRLIATALIVCALAGSALAGVGVNFDDMTLSGSNSYYRDGSFQSGIADFGNMYIPDWNYWEGWAYSKATDTATPGYFNQYSAFTGGGQGGSTNYGVGYMGIFGNQPTISLGERLVVDGAYFTNTTYAVLAMFDGSGMTNSLPFGGADGTRSDWFLLTITGHDGSVTTGSVDFYLADFRFADDSKDYIVGEWTWVDLSSLGVVSDLTFALTSSDTDPTLGMNTPAYFAMDTMVPEPATLMLLGLGATSLLRRRVR